MPIAADPFLATLALIGVVIIIAALLSGLIERSGVPQVGVLLGLGAVLGPYGLALIDPKLDSPVLRAVSTLSLTLVLFTDALGLDLAEIRRHVRLTLLVLGPGTLLSAVLVTLMAGTLLGLPWLAAAVLGAALASTDPVLLRGLLRRPDLPAPARLALRLESGLNDIVLLPIVLIAMALQGVRHGPGEAIAWPRMGLELFLLGPGAGVAVGLLGVATLDLVRRRIGVRRDYESLYSLGIAFAAFAAAEAVHGSGFLAAFAAGMTISVFDVELCDCFHEYGETTAEMTLLFTFVLLGSSLIWTGFVGAGWREVLFAVAVVIVRPVAFLASLWPTRLERRSLLLISWFGPRGLSSLLLVLVTVFAGMPGSDRLFALCSLVVLLSVVLHGGSLMLLPSQSREEPLRESGDERPAAPAAALAPAASTAPEKIDLAEMLRLQEAGEPVVVLDVRAARSYETSGQIAPGTARLDPERSVQEAERLHLPREAWLVAFCA
ncbi:MAG TPA: cation:proton antiporter [Thermoanaerobaculia bacterium]|nr:cation:proton antiporter [Thermoanaerobaculia bacterium]